MAEAYEASVTSVGDIEIVLKDEAPIFEVSYMPRQLHQSASEIGAQAL